MCYNCDTQVIIRMKVAVFFAAICIFALVVPQGYAEEEDEPAVREARGAKAPVMCAAKCQYNSCKKICMHCAICYCSNGINGKIFRRRITPETEVSLVGHRCQLIITIMKDAIFFAAICIFVLVMPQAYAEEEAGPAVRETRDAKAPVVCAAKCQYNPCKKICMHCAICYCSNRINGVCKCCD
ncbi:hypothetical protein LSAT2_006782 [Lamellibrachia satsuma]|nr:hypothetical protein LSAT2_006782 [Lamellibrachia satsuma]